MPTIDRIRHTTELVVEECYKCHMLFAMPSYLRRQCLDEKRTFYCPNGHDQVFCTSETERLRRELKQERNWSRSLQSDVEYERRRLSATKGHMTRLKKRVAAGVCPCCNRTFQNLGRHMKGQHPEWRDSE